MTNESPLGKPTRYPEAYDEGLLYPVDRAPQRAALGASALAFDGIDRWTAWELAWRDGHGRARAAILQFDVPCTSPRIVESKSVKLWLASLYDERFDAIASLEARLRDALDRATGGQVAVRIDPPGDWGRYARETPAAAVIDDEVPISFPSRPEASTLRASGARVEESLLTHTFRSVCPVTGQPDYATVTVRYAGPRIERASLCAYFHGFRRHPGFHEDCAERIFRDIANACSPERLAVDAAFTRRGGIDIRPFRSSDRSFAIPPVRDARL